VIRRAVRSFGKFWWDFLVGDTPEFFVVTLAVVGLAFLLRHHRDVGVIVLPSLVLLSVGTSAWRRRARDR